jgi:hypothetical protein
VTVLFGRVKIADNDVNRLMRGRGARPWPGLATDGPRGLSTDGFLCGSSSRVQAIAFGGGQEYVTGRLESKTGIQVVTS